MRKKGFISIFIVIVALLSFVSGFCVAPFSVKASTASMNDMAVAKMMHSSKKGSTMMPCCSEKSSLGENGIVNAGINEKIVFNFSHLSDSSTYKFQQILKIVDSSSLSAPPEEELTSIIVKKE